MKVRDSGMPAEEMWDSFFNPDLILRKLGMNTGIKNAAEFGSGFGTFSIGAASIISGNLYALDIEKDMLNILKKKTIENNISNIKMIERDFVKDGTGLEDSTVDYVMMFNILHAEEPESLLKEANRILKTGCRIGVIHWIYSEHTPRGPSLNIRPKPEQCVEWLKRTGFEIQEKDIELPPYHYGITAKK